MANKVFSTCKGPPWWGFLRTFGVRVVRLLPRLDELDESLSHDFTSSLLHVLETKMIQFGDLVRIANDKCLSLLLLYWYCKIFIGVVMSMISFGFFGVSGVITRLIGGMMSHSVVSASFHS